MILSSSVIILILLGFFLFFERCINNTKELVATTQGIFKHFNTCNSITTLELKNGRHDIMDKINLNKMIMICNINNIYVCLLCVIGGIVKTLDDYRSSLFSFALSAYI
jgi:hypothetical protein